MNSSTPEYWRKCTSCKKLIGYKQPYWVCSVSTCNRLRTGLIFCSVECFDAHIPVMNHRDAGAFERTAPSKAEALAAAGASPTREARPPAEPEPRTPNPESPPKPSTPMVVRRSASGSLETVSTRAAPPSQASSSPTRPSPDATSDSEDDILVVVSKVKEYIRIISGMNTSDRVMGLLSQRIRAWARDSIARAHQAERKTVLDRDVR